MYDKDGDGEVDPKWAWRGSELAILEEMEQNGKKGAHNVARKGKARAEKLCPILVDRHLGTSIKLQLLTDFYHAAAGKRRRLTGKKINTINGLEDAQTKAAKIVLCIACSKCTHNAPEREELGLHSLRT